MTDTVIQGSRYERETQDEQVNWHLDEMVIIIRWTRYWLWPAVNIDSGLLDIFVQRARGAKPANKLMSKLPK